MKVKKHSGGFRQPSSWVLYELNMLFGFLICDVLEDDEVETFKTTAFKEQKKKYTVFTEFVQPLPVVPELVEAEYADDPVPRARASPPRPGQRQRQRQPHHKKVQDPPGEDVLHNISCRPVLCQEEFSEKDDVDTEAAISPPPAGGRRGVRKMHWADDEISCATGRVVFVQKPLV
jgi:hypothetical protein